MPLRPQQIQFCTYRLTGKPCTTPPTHIHKESTVPLSSLNTMDKKGAAQERIARQWVTTTNQTILSRLYGLNQLWYM